MNHEDETRMNRQRESAAFRTAPAVAPDASVINVTVKTLRQWSENNRGRNHDAFTAFMGAADLVERMFSAVSPAIREATSDGSVSLVSEGNAKNDLDSPSPAPEQEKPQPNFKDVYAEGLRVGMVMSLGPAVQAVLRRAAAYRCRCSDACGRPCLACEATNALRPSSQDVARVATPAPQEQPPAQNEQEARVDATCGSTNSPTASSSKPEADNASLWRGSECFRCRDVKGGIHYNLLTCQERNAMKALREMFPDGQADSLNFVLFSTSGVHGTYSLIEDAETDMLRGWKDEDGEDSEPSVTFAIIHPRVVAIRYGNCLPRTPDDIAFLKRLRASSQRQIMSIGMPGSPVADDAVDPIRRGTTHRPRATEIPTPAPHQEQPDLRTLTFAEFSAVNRKRCESPDGFNHQLASWSTSDWFTAVMGELGEAANVAKKLNRIRDGIPGNKETEAALRDELRKELGDTFVYLDLLCQLHGFNIGSAAAEVFNAKSEQIGCPIRLADALKAQEGR